MDVIWKTPKACPTGETHSSGQKFDVDNNVGDHRYDLTKLRKKTGNWMVTSEGQGEQDKYIYLLNIGWGINGMEYHPKLAVGCPAFAAGCQVGGMEGRSAAAGAVSSRHRHGRFGTTMMRSIPKWATQASMRV